MMDQAHPVKPAPHTFEASYNWLHRELLRIRTETRRLVLEAEKLRWWHR